MPGWLAPCDLGDPGWGDPWFPHGAFVASLTFWYGLVILVFSPLFLLPYHVEMIKGSLGGETSVLRTFRMSGKESVKERVSKERVSEGKS